MLSKTFGKIFLCLALFAQVAAFWLPGAAMARLAVFVSIAPQKYFVKEVAGDLASVHVMVPPGASPETYEPKPAQMAALSKARIYLAIGVPFERAWLGRIASANPQMKIVRTDKEIEKRCMEAAIFGIGKGAGEKGCKENHDPHIWLSPPLVKKQVNTIVRALAEADPQNAAVYEKNGRKFSAEIDALDKELRALFADSAGRCFLVFHPCWGYFADAYGLVQVPVQAEGKEPRPATLGKLIDYARKAGIKSVIVQPQFSAKSAAVIADSIGGRVVVADPLGANWPESMRKAAETIKASLGRCPTS